jgi:alpha-mannosidase
LVKVTGLSALPFKLLPAGAEEETEIMQMKATPNLLSNGIVSAEFDEYGQLCSILIRGEPLLLTRGKATSFTLHDDNPEAYGETMNFDSFRCPCQISHRFTISYTTSDAWDVDHHVVWLRENAIREPVALKVIECGPIVSTLRSDSIPIGSNGSAMEIEYRLYSKEDSLRVSCFVDWRESHKTLRYEVPTDYCGDYARFGSPFNFVDRSQIPQTHKEEGQWEVPASRWASILNGSMDGLSIVTQSKYGFRAKLGILSFTLLRSSTFPDPKADQGKHRIQFAITKHQNTFQYANKDDDLIIPTAAKADELFTQPLVLSKANTIFISNAKPIIRFTELGSAVPSWVMPSMCKIGQGQGFCVRLHEVSGANTNISFSIASLEDYQIVLVESVNFNEKRLAMLDSQSVDGETMESAYTLPIAAYKIMTLRILYS